MMIFRLEAVWKWRIALAAALAGILFLIKQRKLLKLKLVRWISSAAIKKLVSAKGGPCETGIITTKNGLSFKAFLNAPPTLGEFFTNNCREHRDKEFVVHVDIANDATARYTFGKTLKISIAFQHALVKEFGLKRGDRVAILMANLPEFMFAYIASTSAGGVAVALNAFWEGNEIKFGIEDAKAEILVTDYKRLERLEKAGHLQHLLDKGLRIILVNERNQNRFPLFKDLVSQYSDVDIDTDHFSKEVCPDDVASILYTSGTSSPEAKGVCLTHRSFLQATWGFVLFFEMLKSLRGPTAHPRVDLITSPLFHASQFSSTFLQAFRNGTRVVLMPKWDVDAAIEVLERERVTNCGFMPLMLGDLLSCDKFYERKDNFCLHSVGTGGAATPSNLIHRLHKVLPGLSQGSGWGMTETNAVGTIIGGPEYLAFPRSCGRPHILAEVKVVDHETGKTIEEPGQEGELCIRSICNMKGYWGRPCATSEVLMEDGWIRTGDMGKIDAQGYCFITDRIKDICIRGGENISVIEVEDCLHRISGVVEVACFGLKHKRLGEELVAVLCANSNAQNLSPDYVRSFASQHLARFKVPSTIHIRDFQKEPLPRGHTGKILKRSLKQQYV